MHYWGDKDVDWAGINAAARFIGINLRRWGRIQVVQYKEKYGTVRVYCHLGWNQFHCITHPGHVYSRYPEWLWKLDCYVGSKIIRVFNPAVITFHKFLYRFVYKKAISKWPHLREEILCVADYSDLLNGL